MKYSTRYIKFTQSIALLFFCFSSNAYSELIQPGDLRLKHDIQLLSDAGIITAPISGWPIFLSGISLNRDEIIKNSPNLITALERVFPEKESHDDIKINLGFSASNETDRIRGYQSRPRKNEELSWRLATSKGRFYFDLRAKVDKTHIGKNSARPTGSYIGMAIGNWFISANAASRWWGPGWDGSLIFSNNIRGIHSLSINRRVAKKFDIPFLKWLGPWTTQILYGKLEKNRNIEYPHLFGWRMGFKPLNNLEVGLSRVAQFCGKGRECNSNTFTNMLLGNDNGGDNISIKEEPGNQLAGFDLRYSLKKAKLPFAIYTQWIGEDEFHGLPSAYMGQVGIETWGFNSLGNNYRSFFEWSDTSCDVIGGSPQLGCAYEHSIYKSGYRYKSRSIGHTIDSDSRMLSLGGLIINDEGHIWSVVARKSEINRSNGKNHTISITKEKISSIELMRSLSYRKGSIRFTFTRELSDINPSKNLFSIQWSWRN
ncbi:MAG: hypothetical protein CBC38_02095 [Gammaproteobacteria bacterium TMED78]|nr:MAG: hypothetical protein CBC38_02095 [Gammaproteobacteria bacterium TMED78]|tara:strand:- start:215331 stop:216782 length:1452 start_codon:yes stop_codon:yes gene_type:complete